MERIKVVLEYASGGRWDRPALQNLLRGLKPGDVLVVWKLDRLTRSLSDLLQIIKRLEEIGAGFQSLTEAIDTTTPVGGDAHAALGKLRGIRKRNDPREDQAGAGITSSQKATRRKSS